MPNSCMLLRESLALLRGTPDIVAGPEHHTERDALVLRIETFLADSEALSAHPAIALARERWEAVSFLRVDPEERRVEAAADGVWVRGWIKVDYPAAGGMHRQTTDRYERALADLPTLQPSPVRFSSRTVSTAWIIPPSANASPFRKARWNDGSSTP